MLDWAMTRASTSAGARRSWRRRLLRVWMACALPWLALVITLSIHDHHRAIGRTALSGLSLTTSGEPVTLAELSELGALNLLAYAARWLQAAIAYSGDAITFYGLLPAGLTFALYVLFLPWATHWARQGTIQD